MKIKFQIAIPVFAVCVAVVLISGKINMFSGVKNELDDIRMPSKEERLKMSNAERIALLERLGHLPDDPDYPSDYRLAENTTWWGKRLDPMEFWKDRVVWLDNSADFAARRHGRGYPPMPYDEPSLTNRNDTDWGGKGSVTSWDTGWEPGFVFSEREMVFWGEFGKTHLQPPANIKSWLKERADGWMSYKFKLEIFDQNNMGVRVTQRTYRGLMESNLDKTNIYLFPPEAVSPEAFHWDHVMRKRAEYEALVASGREDDEKESKWFFDRVFVDHALITEPLTDEQIDAANAWKVAYLKRLRSEEWDESYINAYLQAWNLTEEYVFENEKEKTHEK